MLRPREEIRGHIRGSPARRKRPADDRINWVWEKLKDWEKKANVNWFKPFIVPGKARPSVDDVKRWCRTGNNRKIDPSAPDVNDVPSCMSTWGVCDSVIILFGLWLYYMQLMALSAVGT